MKNRYASAFLLAASAAVAVGAAGCSSDKGKEAKEHMQAALTKQAEMKTYSFSGTADLNLEAPAPAQGSNPLTSAVLNMFLKGKLEWNGAASTDPVRLEATIKSTPTGSTTPFELPVLFKDNKMYLHIPMLNKDGEFFSVDMAELSGLSGSGNPLTPESLKNIGKALSDTANIAIADLNPKWFAEKKDDTLKDGAKAVSYRLDITDKNVKELNEVLKAKWPQLADSLKSSGLLTDAQAAQWKAPGGGAVLKAPGTIAVKVDESGMLREETLNLALDTQGKDGQLRPASFQINQAYNEVNQPPKFSMEIPANARPLSDILKLLMPQAKGK